jgi:two-component system NtrC family response regulator
MTDTFRTLVVDDEPLYAQAIGLELFRRGISCDLAYCGQEALAQVERQQYHAILLDHRLPDEDGIEIIPIILSRQPDATVIVMTAYHAIPHAVHAIRRGATDYVVKSSSTDEIVGRLLEIERQVQVRKRYEDWVGHREEGPLGRSTAMQRVRAQLDKIALAPDTTVLLTGETGVGKEVAARYLHQVSRPKDSPMVVLDCIALPSNLAESLLFGHEKGAFTGAGEGRIGAFEEAGAGTILLDEIGDMSDVQGKLLRVLESRRFQRVGSVKERPLRARVIGATNRDLAEDVKRGTFRHDLYQRLSVFPIQIPPLRERGDDVLLLAEHFRNFFSERLGKPIAPLGDEVRDRLLAYSYPGNVRELKNIIERAMIMAESDRLCLEHLPERLLRSTSRTAGAHPSIPVNFVPGIDSLETLEKRMIRQAMKRAGNVKAEAARFLGISRYQILRRMEKYGMRFDSESGE